MKIILLFAVTYLIAHCFSAFSAPVVKPLNALTANPSKLFQSLPKYFETIIDETADTSGMLSDIVQDQKGFLWFSGQRGIARFDGYKIKQYRHDPQLKNSLVNDIVSALYITESQQIWAATSQGVSIFDPKSEAFTNYVSDDSKISLSSNDVDNLAEWSELGMWVGTSAGLNFFNYSQQQFSVLPSASAPPAHLSQATINDLYILATGDLLLASGQEIWLVKRESHEFINLLALDNNEVSKIFQSASGNIWLGLRNGQVALFNIATSELNYVNNSRGISLPDDIIKDFAEPIAGQIWLAYDYSGLAIIDEKSLQVSEVITNSDASHGQLQTNLISSLFVDRSHLLWITTLGKGLQRYSPHNQSFATLRSTQKQNRPKKVGGKQHSLTDTNIVSLMETMTNELWIGHYQGVDIFSLSGNKKHYFSPPISADNSPISISAMTQDKYGTVWLGASNQGLIAVDPNNYTIQQHLTVKDGLRSDKVRHIVNNADGTFWIGSFKGIQHFDPITKIFSDFQPQHNDENKTHIRITDHLILQNGQLVFTTSDGLFWLPDPIHSKKGYHFTKQNPASSSLVANIITAIEQTPQGDLWLAGIEGLSQVLALSPEQSSFQYKPNSGKHSEAKVFSNLLADTTGRLWESSLVYDAAKDKLYELEPADGVDIGNDWVGTSLTLSNGTLAFGGSSGLLFVWPEYYKPWHYQPNIVLTAIQIDKKPIIANDNVLIIPAHAKGFSVEFSALDYSMPEKNRYKYRLSGYDEKWHDADTEIRQVNYTNLFPDTYQLEIIASNRAGQWLEKPFTLTVTVQAKFYQTSWFFMLVIILICTLAYQFFMNRMKALAKRGRQITEQKLALERVALMKDRLAEREQARLELAEANQALTIEKNRAESATSAKSRFLANMSHEIRTPMNAILGMSYLTLRTSLSTKQQEYVSKIESAAEGLLVIINDILDLSKIESGHMQLSPQPYNLQKSVQRCIDLLSLQAQNKGLLLRVELDSTLPEMVIGDHGKLEQVLINLLNNAIKFTHQGEVCLAVRVVNNAEQHCRVTFQVIDTGIGIAEDKLATITDAFIQADDSITRDYGGTGLGLKICLQLIELMGGQLAITSELGKGSQLSFTIDMQQTDKSALANTDSLANSSSKLTKPKILLADDHAINRQILETLLKQANLNVDSVVNGLEVLDKIKTSQYDIIIMDVNMPLMDGYETTQNIRNQAQFKHLPIIAVTAYALNTDKAEALKRGMTDYLAKPIRPQSLYQCLSKWCAIPQALLNEQQSQATETELPAVLNTAKGLENLAGDQGVYIKILGHFVDSHKNDLTTMAKYHDEADIKQLCFLLHKTKGAVGNIGAAQLHQEICHYESAVKQGVSDLPETIKTGYETLFLHIKSWLAEQVNTEDTVTLVDTPLDVEQCLLCLNQLHQKIRNRSFNLQNELSQVKQSYDQYFSRELKQLQRSIDGYQFSLSEQQIVDLHNKTQAIRQG